jgi:short-subunit dehydrogenase
VLSFSEALHEELKPRGVRVTALCPGPVPTEFQARAGIFSGHTSGILARSAEQVARAGYRGLMRGRRVVVPGWSNKLVTTVVRFAPKSVLLPPTGRALAGGRHAKRPKRT